MKSAMNVLEDLKELEPVQLKDLQHEHLNRIDAYFKWLIISGCGLVICAVLFVVLMAVM